MDEKTGGKTTLPVPKTGNQKIVIPQVSV